MPTVSEYKAQAEQLERDGQLEKARTIYTHVVTHLESSPAIWKELNLYKKAGDLAVELGDPDDAVQLYERCAERHAEQGNTDEVVELCRRVVEAVPDQVGVYKRLTAKLLEHDYVEPARLLLLAMAERTGREKTVKQLKALAMHKPPVIKAAIEKAFMGKAVETAEPAPAGLPEKVSEPETEVEQEELVEEAPEEEQPEAAADEEPEQRDAEPEEDAEPIQPEPFVIRTAEEEMQAAEPAGEVDSAPEDEEASEEEAGEPADDLLVSRSFDEEMAAVAPTSAGPEEGLEKPAAAKEPRVEERAAAEPPIEAPLDEPKPLSPEEEEVERASKFAERFSVALPRDEALELDEIGGGGRSEEKRKPEKEPEPEREPEPPKVPARPVRQTRRPTKRHRRPRRGLRVAAVSLIVVGGAAALVMTGAVPLDSLPFLGSSEPSAATPRAADATGAAVESEPASVDVPLLPDPDPVVAAEAFPPIITRRAPTPFEAPADSEVAADSMPAAVAVDSAAPVGAADSAPAVAVPESMPVAAAPAPMILVVDGVPIEGVEDLGGPAGGYRVSQRLESGALLSLVVTPGGAIAVPVVEAQGDTAVGMIQRGRMTVVLRARVTPEAMRALLERVVQVPRP